MLPERYRKPHDRQPYPFSKYLEQFAEGDGSLRCFSELVRRQYGTMGWFREQISRSFETGNELSLRSNLRHPTPGEITCKVISHEAIDEVDVFEIINLLRADWAIHEYLVVGKDPQIIDAHLLTVKQDGTVDVSPDFL